MANILVCGYMIRYPVAGNLLSFFHYVLGLRRLGHKVFYLEEGGWANSCYDPVNAKYSDIPEPGFGSVRHLFESHRLHDVKYAYIAHDRRRVWGGSWKEVESCIRSADLILNIGGVNWLDEFSEAKRLAYIDMDPLFTQSGRFGFERLANHAVHFSYGTRIGRPTCTVPTLGLEWIPLLPPVVPEIWKPGSARASTLRHREAFTTIASWHAYGGIEVQGEHYGQKDEEFKRYESVPSNTGARIELATNGMPEPIRASFLRSGWRIVSAVHVSKSSKSYCAYIQRSAGEFSVAKNAYVKSR